MKNIILVISFLLLFQTVTAQKTRKNKPDIPAQPLDLKIPMTPERWIFNAVNTEFVTHKGVPAMKIGSGSDKVVLKGFTFTDGTIEFDFESSTPDFTGIYFRRNDESESEFFYMRMARAGDPKAMDAVQYAPIVDSVNLWDLLDHYQGPAVMKMNDWNHIKLVVSGRQMLVYVNDNDCPTLEIPRLEGNFQSGGLALSGRSSVLANLVITPNETEGLSAREGFDPTNRDSRYIRKWHVQEPYLLPEGRELFAGEFPKADAVWKDMAVERRGLLNLTRSFGGNKNRKVVWVRAKIQSEKDQRRNLSLGFSDEVWVFLNRQMVFVDKNEYLSEGMRKTPDGRISIENASFALPLKAGENELLIGVANDFYGWGIIARLDVMTGIVIEQ